MPALFCAACIVAIYYAGGLFATNPEASVVIASLAAGFLGIFYAAVTEGVNEGEDTEDPPLV